MHGPEVVGVELCTMGVACTVELGENSVGLAATNQIIVTALGDDCGQASLNVAVFTAMINPTPVNGNLYNNCVLIIIMILIMIMIVTITVQEETILTV